MLFCLCLVALLLYDTVFASAVCSQTFDKAPGKIEAVSTHYHHLGRRKCVYLIRAPLDFSISLNFTDIFGFIPTATAATSTATTSAATDSSTTTTTTTSSSSINASISITNNVAGISSTSPKERHNQHHHHQQQQQQQLQQQQHHSRYRHPHLASSEAEELTSQAVPTVTLINGPIRRGQCRLPQVEILEEDETSGDRVVMGKICRSSHGNQLLLLVSGQEKNKNVNSSSSTSSSSSSASVTTMTTNSNVTSSSFDSGTSSSAITTAQPQKVFHSLAHTLRLVYEWGLGPHHSGFSLEFNFQHKPTTPFEINKSGPCEFTCADSRCISSWSMVCDGSDDCADRSDEHDCPYHHRHLPPTEGRSKFGSNEVSSIQIIIIVLAVVLAVGVIAFMVSHYKMGARSWSDRWTRTSSQQVSQTGQQQQHHHHHSHPSPQHHHQYHHPHQQQHHNNHLDHNNTSTTTAYVQPHDDRLSHEVALFRERQIRLQSVQTDLELALPPSISLPDGEEYPYDSLQHLHLRNAEQESEILRECIRPPPNRTIFEGESPPPYRACSMGTLHSSSSSSSTFSLMSGSANNGALRVRSADYSAPLVMRCHSMCSNNCNCGGSGHHHSSSSGSGGSTSSSSSNSSSSSSSSSGSVAGGGRGTTPLSHHLRIARLVNSRPSNAASSTSLPASSSVTSTFSSSSCSFCDPPTAASSSSVNYNHNGHGNRCPNGAITTSTNRCCRLNVTKTEQRPGTTGLNGGLSSSSSGSSNSGGGGGVSSSHAMTTAAVSASSAGVGHTRVTDNLNGSRHHPVTLTLTEGSRDVEEDRNRNCSGGNAGSGHGGGGGNNATGGNAGV